MNLYPVIMCGGSGARLWPASRPSRPKQFISLTGEASLFQQTVQRLQGLEGAHRLIVVAGAAHADAIAAQLAALGAEADVLLEPEARDSAPAMAAAGAWIATRDPQGVAVVLASDHHMPDGEAFRAAVRIAAAEAVRGRIVTLGVKPTEPTSAYGYIRPAAGAAPGAAARVEVFVEKPDRATAERYLGEGYLWNSGNFIVSAATLLDELDRHAPEVSACAREGVAQARATGAGLHLGDAFRQAPRISIDYALMEKTDRASVLPVHLAWSDLGAWDSVKAVLPADADGNAVAGNALLLDSRNCLVRAEPGVLATVIGVDDLAVIADRDAILVCRIDKAQSVKAVTEALKAEQRPQADVAVRTPSLADEARRIRRWLFGAALPLWWTVGADHEAWGFREKLDLDGRPVDAARRCRVQTRQAYVYAMAGALGWPGPWREATRHGLDGLVARYRRPDGLYRTLVGPAGEALDETAMLYDQAFVLLALATGRSLRPTADAEALDLLDAIEAHLRHPAGGFREAGEPTPFQSNPHMHLFEACLAWIEAEGAEHRARFEAVAAEIAELALTRFIDADGGFLREFFAADWSPAPGEAGRIVEPGHQFEWAWLLERWALRTGDPRVSAAARRLYAVGRRGIDPVRGVAIDQLNPDLSVRSASARLWPQTERLKAALILGDEPQAKAAVAGLWKYLAVETPGVWRDKYRPDGTFVDEPAPASSLYHIVAAIAELERVAGG